MVVNAFDGDRREGRDGEEGKMRREEGKGKEGEGGGETSTLNSHLRTNKEQPGCW